MSHPHETETGQVTGTIDKDYDLFRYIEGCLRTAQRMETYRRDAERDNDTALAALFAMTQSDSRKGAEIGKKLLISRLVATAPAATGEGAVPTETEGAVPVGAEGTAPVGAEGTNREANYAPKAGEQAREEPPFDVMAPTPPRTDGR